MCDEMGIVVIDECPAVGLEDFNDIVLALHKKSLTELVGSWLYFVITSEKMISLTSAQCFGVSAAQLEELAHREILSHSIPDLS